MLFAQEPINGLLPVVNEEIYVALPTLEEAMNNQDSDEDSDEFDSEEYLPPNSIFLSGNYNVIEWLESGNVIIQL